MKRFLSKFNWLIALMIIILIVSRIFFYSLVEASVFSKGFFFDVIIDIGLVYLLSFIFKKPRGQKVSFSMMLIGYIIVYIADYMYYKSGINKIASITALYSAGFVDMGAYGVSINFNVILFVIFGLLFLVGSLFYRPQVDKKVVKRKKRYLLISLITIIPYLYAFSVASKSYDSYLMYLKSDTKTFNDLDRSYYMFMEEFGYSVFRYEDVNRSVEVIIETMKEAE